MRIAKEDMKAVREEILECLFNMGIAQVEFIGDKPNYYLSADSMKEYLQFMLNCLEKDNSDICYTENIKEFFGDDANQRDKTWTKFLQSRKSCYNARMVFNALTERMIKIWGEWVV